MQRLGDGSENGSGDGGKREENRTRTGRPIDGQRDKQATTERGYEIVKCLRAMRFDRPSRPYVPHQTTAQACLCNRAEASGLDAACVPRAQFNRERRAIPNI